ncbi:MAG: DUF2277 domain-containing protein [Anaerolineae bacterium]|nr:DUF2277 domain-containing protein [Anaerolineae bacterium]
MCRSIKQLRRSEIPATPEEIEAAARQFVRKVSGYRQPSRRNEAVFEQAISEISEATEKLLNSLLTNA